MATYLLERLTEGGTTSLITSLLGSETTTGVTTSDATSPKADEATQVMTTALASDRPLTPASWLNSGKLTEDELDGVEDGKP